MILHYKSFGIAWSYGVFKVEYDDGEMEGVEAVADEGVSVEDLLSSKHDMSVLKEFLPFNGVLNLEGVHLPLLSVQCLCQKSELKNKLTMVASPLKGDARNNNALLVKQLQEELKKYRNYR